MASDLMDSSVRWLF